MELGILRFAEVNLTMPSDLSSKKTRGGTFDINLKRIGD